MLSVITMYTAYHVWYVLLTGQTTFLRRLINVIVSGPAFGQRPVFAGNNMTVSDRANLDLIDLSDI